MLNLSLVLILGDRLIGSKRIGRERFRSAVFVLYRKNGKESDFLFKIKFFAGLCRIVINKLALIPYTENIERM